MGLSLLALKQGTEWGRSSAVHLPLLSAEPSARCSMWPRTPACVS